MAPELEKELRKHMSDEQWTGLQAACAENGIELNEDCLEFGSLFLLVKYWFIRGWDSRG